MDPQPSLVYSHVKGGISHCAWLYVYAPTYVWLAGVYLTYVLHHGVGLVQLGLLKVVAVVLQSVP